MLTVSERVMIATALRAEGDALLRDARSRKHAGPVYQLYRADLRREAAQYHALAERFRTRI